jgi:uncharacterized protein
LKKEKKVLKTQNLKKMFNWKLLSLFLCISLPFLGQSNFVVHHVNDNSIELKWYTSTLLNIQKTDVYRSENGAAYQKIATGIAAKAYVPTASDYQEDKELKDMLNLVSKSKKLESFGLLMATLKSFKSVPFAKVIGIYFQDVNVKPGLNYTYKVCYVNESVDKAFATSSIISMNEGILDKGIDSIKFELKKRTVSFGWLPEVQKYYGVDIYRSLTKDSIGTKITKDPILISKIKNKKNEEVFPEFHFADEKLKEKQTYYYTLVPLDFFNKEMKKSEQIKVRIKDLTFPLIVTDLKQNQFGNKVYLTWYKAEKEDDFLGYKVYCSQFNDSLFLPLNEKLLNFEDSSFSYVPNSLGVHFYKVAAIDEDENEALSAEVITEVIDNDPPSIPTGMNIVADTGRLIVRWNANPEGDILGYKLYRSVKGDESSLALISSLPIIGLEFIDPLPKNAINSFTYSVFAIDTNLNEGKRSKMFSSRMMDATAPKAPFIKEIIQIDEKTIKIVWLKNTELDLKGYLLTRKDESDSLADFVQVNLNMIPTSVAEYTDRKINVGKKYAYKLFALDSMENQSTASNVYKFQGKEKKEKLDITLKITALKYKKMQSGVKIRWKPSKYPENIKFMVFKQSETGDLKPLTKLTNDLSLIDLDVLPGQIVKYQIRLYDNNGNMVKSEIETITIPKKRK